MIETVVVWTLIALAVFWFALAAFSFWTLLK